MIRIDAPIARFDGAAIWSTLTPDQQRELGALALEIVVAWHLEARVYEDGNQLGERYARLSSIGDAELINRLQEAFVDAIAETELDAEDGSPKVPSLLGPVCRRCGCTDNHACEGGCGWAEPDLCAACVQT